MLPTREGSRGGHEIAGTAHTGAADSLLAARPLVRGRYTLALTSQRGRRVTTIRRVVAVS
ncbi:MAG TPA: hypothetical protein VIM18_13830 [Solirubrobacteraceae bacterium]